MDFTKDNNPTGIDFVKDALKSEGFDIPSYVTDKVDTEQITKLASSAYADDILKLYPINSKENIWKSAAYFYTNGIDNQQLDETASKKIASNINTAAEMFNIKEDIDNIMSVLTSKFNKLASAEESLYALTVENQEGEEVNYLPINNIFEIVKSASELDGMYNKMIPEYYYNACINLVKVAKAKGINLQELPKAVVDAGTPKVFNYDFAIKQASFREEKTGDTLYTELVRNAKYASEHGEFDTMEYATLMFDLDKLHSDTLGYTYNKSNYVDPVGVFSGGETKEAVEKFASEHVLFQDIFIPCNAFLDKEDIITKTFSKKASESILSAIKSKDTIAAAVALEGLNQNDKIDLLNILTK